MVHAEDTAKNAIEVNMEGTLKVLNDLEREGIISRYAIGGAMGATFYVEPLLTFDLDIFLILPQTQTVLVSPRCSHSHPPHDSPVYGARHRCV